MKTMTDHQKITRLHAIGQRITDRVTKRPSLLAETALCDLSRRITVLMVKIATRRTEDGKR